jgi:hypothetical protein
MRALVKASVIPSIDALKTVGLVQLPGITSQLNLGLDGPRFEGSGHIEVLGTGLFADELVIDADGTIRGAFRGQLQARDYTLSEVSLEVMNDGLMGSARIDVPGP